MHLGDESLSAYLDGELSPSEATVATAHLGECASCASALRLFRAVDEHVAAAPALSCSAAEAFLSAKLDGELGPEEAAIASAHLSDCAACRSDVHRWSLLEQTVAAMPVVAPSRRVDTAIAKLGEQRRVRLPRIVGAWPLPTLAVVTAISLILVLSLPQGGPNVARIPVAPLVAAAEQSVLNPNTNTLYVLSPDQATVAALDAKTYAQKAVAHIGGRPTALALNLAKNTVIVLDASAKTVTEIDGASMAVTSSTQVSVPGTPTSVQVDPKGNLVVSSVVTPTAGPSATPGASPTGAGVISMIDGGTKQVDAVIQVDVAPQVIVIEPNGRRALLVSAKQTILADAATYSPLASAVGGVSAAFQIGGDNYAVLSNSVSGAVLTFGRGGSFVVGGTPHAITALPGGGFAVLADAAGRGVISLITGDGGLLATIDAPANATDLAFEPLSARFAVIGPLGVAKVDLPQTIVRIPTPPTTPLVSGTPSPAPQTASTPSVAPAPVPTEPAVVVALPRDDNGLVPTSARSLWPGTYFVSISSSQRPVRTASDGTRIWYLDELNRINVFHVLTGDLFQVGALPPSARVNAISISPNHVYFVDPWSKIAYVLAMSTEQVTSVPLPPTIDVTAIAASPDERLWLATSTSGLVSYDPRASRIQTVAVGDDLSALAVDSLGRVWTAARSRQAVDLWDPLTNKVTEIALAHNGLITALAVDVSDYVWVGTDLGQTFTLRAVSSGNALVGSGSVGRPISGIVRDRSGQLDYVSRTGVMVTYGWIRGTGAPHVAPGSTTELMFDSLGRAWQGDPAASGFYVTLPGGRP